MQQVAAKTCQRCQHRICDSLLCIMTQRIMESNRHQLILRNNYEPTSNCNIHFFMTTTSVLAVSHAVDFTDLWVTIPRLRWLFSYFWQAHCKEETWHHVAIVQNSVLAAFVQICQGLQLFELYGFLFHLSSPVPPAAGRLSCEQTDHSVDHSSPTPFQNLTNHSVAMGVRGPCL